MNGKPWYERLEQVILIGPSEIGETCMRYEQREHLAGQFATLIEKAHDQWANFAAAAERERMEPYTMLSRMLVRIAEREIEGLNDSIAEALPWQDN